MKRQVLAAFAIAAALSAGAGSAVIGSRLTGPPAAHPGVSSPASCQEDEACWDWRTMGNRQRGVCIDDVDWLEHADPAAPYDVQRRTYRRSLGGCSHEDYPCCGCGVA